MLHIDKGIFINQELKFITTLENGVFVNLPEHPIINPEKNKAFIQDLKQFLKKWYPPLPINRQGHTYQEALACYNQENRPNLDPHE
jgi:hypothetical protein